jgi:hypothetical protein
MPGGLGTMLSYVVSLGSGLRVALSVGISRKEASIVLLSGSSRVRCSDAESLNVMLDVNTSVCC